MTVAEQPSRRLGQGELSDPQGAEARTVAQARFLQAVRKDHEARRALQHLADLAGWGGNDSEGERAIDSDALRAWGARWHLSDPWCLDVARDTLAAWYGPTWHSLREEGALDGRDWRDSLDWTYPVHIAPKPIVMRYPGNGQPVAYFDHDEVTPIPLDPTFFYWNPLHESRADAKARMHAVLEAHLDGFKNPISGEIVAQGHLDRIEEAARAAELVPPTEKRAREHFRWLVTYQMVKRADGKPHSFADIASGHQASRKFRASDDMRTLTRQSVQQALAETAKLCDLTLRSSPAGRPKRGQARTMRMRPSRADVA